MDLKIFGFFQLLFYIFYLDFGMSSRNDSDIDIDIINIDWTHQMTLPGGVIQLKWTNEDSIWITMEVRGRTQGYIGIGFSPSGTMSGSDILLGWVNTSGVPNLKDYHGVTNGVPIEDDQQDYQLIYGTEENGETRLIFRRKWDTCDNNDKVIEDEGIRVIWAWSPNDPEEEKSLHLHYHGLGQRRGVQTIFFRRFQEPMKFPEKNTSDTRIKYWDIAMYNVDIPQTVDPLFLCKIYQFPKLNNKHHIIGYRPLISAESLPYIHDIILYKCHVHEGLGKTIDFFAKYIDYPVTNCFSQKCPYDWRAYCWTTKFSIGAGTEGEMYPLDIGDPIGNEEGDLIYLKLEIRYQNPFGYNLMDSSGIRIYYTDQLRRYEISTLFTGYRRTPFLSVPPFQSNFKIFGQCSTECTKAAFPITTGVKAFSILLRAHETGRKLTLRHIRNEIELEPLAYDNNYDNNYQGYRKLSKDVTILPGDELLMECEYDTERNETFIFGGLSTTDEICEALILYYPRSNLEDCRSQIEFYSYLDAFGVQNATGTILRKLNLPFDPLSSSTSLSKNQQNLTLPDDVLVLGLSGLTEEVPNLFSRLIIRNPINMNIGKNLFNYMQNLDWRNKTFVKSVETKWRNAPRYTYCTGVGGKRVNHPNHIVKIMKYIVRPEKETQCDRQGSNSGNLATFCFLIITSMVTLLLTFCI